MFVFVLLCITLCPFSVATRKRKRKLVALLLLSYRCFVTINVLWLFHTVPWVGLRYVIVVFPDHTHLFTILGKNALRVCFAHLSHWLMLSYCGHWMPVFRRQSSVVRRQQLLQKTSPPKLLAGF